MKTVDIDVAKSSLPGLLAKLEADHETIVICRNGRPVADLVPHRRVNRLKIHPVLSKVEINYDATGRIFADEWPEDAR